MSRRTNKPQLRETAPIRLLAGPFPIVEKGSHLRRFKLPPPANIQDPEIKAAMIIPDLQIPEPGDFTGYIKAEHLGDFDIHTQKIFLAMSVQDQWRDWQGDSLLQLWRHVQQLDAEIARLKIEQAKFKKIETVWNTLKWLGTTVMSGLVLALGKWLWDSRMKGNP